MGDPAVLFLDEPTTGLDPQSRRQAWEILSACRRNGCTTVLTTHYMEEAERLCDRVAIVDRGRIIAEGPPRQLIARLGGDHVVEFSLQTPRGPGPAGGGMERVARHYGVPVPGGRDSPLGCGTAHGSPRHRWPGWANAIGVWQLVTRHLREPRRRTGVRLTGHSFESAEGGES